MIVVDTNIIAYFVINGMQTSSAQKVFDADPDWSAPQLWKSEMRNVLSLHIWQKLMTLDEALIAINKAEEVIAGREYDVDSHRVIELANASGCSAYDCEFVSLAERIRLPLVTSDKKLLVAFPAIAISTADFVGRSG